MSVRSPLGFEQEISGWLELHEAVYKGRQGTPVKGRRAGRGGAKTMREGKGVTKWRPATLPISYIEGRLGGYRCLARSPERLRVLERQRRACHYTRSSLERGPEHGVEPGSRFFC